MACCPECTGDAVLREGWRGGLFFDAVHTEHAFFSGELYLSYTNMLDPDAPWDVLTELGKGHLYPMMQGNGMMVLLGARDMAWLQRLLDEEKEEINEYVADGHRLERLLSVWRRETAKRKRATEVIGEAVVGWGLRPGGTLYKRRKISFERSQSSPFMHSGVASWRK